MSITILKVRKINNTKPPACCRMWLLGYLIDSISLLLRGNCHSSTELRKMSSQRCTCIHKTIQESYIEWGVFKETAVMYSHFNIYFRLNVGGVLPVRPLCAPSCELTLALGFLTTFQLNVSFLCCSAATSATTDRYHRSLVSACYRLVCPWSANVVAFSRSILESTASVCRSCFCSVQLGLDLLVQTSVSDISASGV